MTDEIVVKVNSYGPGRPLSLVWFDPVSGRKVAKSAKTKTGGKPSGRRENWKRNCGPAGMPRRPR